jgi:outer membrane protein assembly factor BamB
MFKFAYTLLALSTIIAASGVTAADVRYPDNPYVDRSDIYISFDGVHAYGRDNFKKQWAVLPGEHTFAPVAHQNVLLVGSSRGLYALRTLDGSVLWNVESDNEVFTPIIVNGIAYAGSRNGTLYAFNVSNGHEQWRTTFPGWVYSPAYLDDTLITGGQDATLWGLDPLDGEQRWSRELPGELVFRAVPGAPRTVLATTFAADLIAIDASSGMQQWRRQTPTANMTPCVSANRIFLTGLDAAIRGLDLDTGTIDWETQLRGRLTSLRLVGDGYVLVSNDEGEVFLLNGENGMMVGEARFAGEAVGAPFVRHGSIFQFFQNSGQLSIVAATEISVD